MPEPANRLTIFQKLEVVNYAKEVAKDKNIITFRVRGKSAPKRKARLKGVNITAACKARFPRIRGSVTKWMRAAEKQRWGELTLQQQKSCYQLTDEMKMVLGLADRVKGYKALGKDEKIQRLTENAALPRWNVPGPVMEVGLAKNCCM